MPQFTAARQHLQGLNSNSLTHWARSVRALSNARTQIPVPVNAKVWRLISKALLGKEQILIDYLSRNKGAVGRYQLHSVGLVARHLVSYLIAHVGEYGNLRHFALHRIQQVVLLDESASTTQDFDIDEYIKLGAFSMGRGENTLLIADVHPQLAWILRETLWCGCRLRLAGCTGRHSLCLQSRIGSCGIFDHIKGAKFGLLMIFFRQA
ncbi:helix-turn-helix transcriptional regulator [Pseudomonas sp. F1_0610]|uniref:helix-turn-helix transcriptional regulator n=1 Tax=Pseudomonas sp. F1_0610 TaxID=3114284 RepID=UPI0039C2D766